MDFSENLRHANDFLRSIVKVEACARCRRNAQLAQKRLSAVMTAAQGEAILIRHADDIVRMNGPEHKADHSGTCIARSENPRPRNLLDQRASVQGKLLIVFEDPLAPDLDPDNPPRSLARSPERSRACLLRSDGAEV